jgi:hypothetical protein
VLEGRIITPIITKKTIFYLKGCQMVIRNLRRRYYSKINSGKPMFPYSFECYLGSIELSCIVKNNQKAHKKLEKLLEIHSIGRFTSEGLGRIKWISGCVIEITNEDSSKRHGLTLNKMKLDSVAGQVWVEKPDGQSKGSKPKNTSRKGIFYYKIRKGLPHYLPSSVKQLLQYALLHDFFNTDKHPSKIYVEPILDDSDLIDKLRRHHERNTSDLLIKTFQSYDHLAAIITRKIRSPVTSRYNWRARKRIDHVKVALEIGELANHVWKLYTYVFQSKEIGLLNESMQFGHSSLREHLLVIANLIVNDYLARRTKVIKT